MPTDVGQASRSTDAPSARSPSFSADRLSFRTMEERLLYLALREAQAGMPEFDSFTIAPLCKLRVPGHTWEVDFMISYRGRTGVIEVDGATHHGRWAADRSRDRLLEDAGIAYVDRIDVQDVRQQPELEAFVRRFLKRLSST